MDGIDACRAIVNRPVRSHPPPLIVFVTANASQSYKNDCLKAGGWDFLPKPFNLQDIASCLQKVQQEMDRDGA